MEEGDEEFLEWKQVLAQEESDFERKEKSRWEYSSEVIGQYRKLAPYILFDHGDLIWEISDGLNIEGTLLKYFEGQATLDQVLLELDNKVAMLYLEMK